MLYYQVMYIYLLLKKIKQNHKFYWILNSNPFNITLQYREILLFIFSFRFNRFRFGCMVVKLSNNPIAAELPQGFKIQKEIQFHCGNRINKGLSFES